MSALAYNYGPVADIEIVWILIAALGITYSVRNFHDALDDLRFLYEPPPDGAAGGEWSTWHLLQVSLGRRTLARKAEANGRYPLAWSSTRVEAYRIGIQIIFILIGVLSMLVDSPAVTRELAWKYLAIGIAVQWGLIFASVLVTMQSIENRRMRRNVRAAYREEAHESH